MDTHNTHNHSSRDSRNELEGGSISSNANPIIELMRISPVESLYSRMAASNTLDYLRDGKLILGSHDIEQLRAIREVLNGKEMASSISSGNISVAIIKPDSHHGRNLPDSDEKAASFLRKEIGEENIAISLNYKFSKSDAEIFYDSEREKYSAIIEDGQTIWERLINYASSKPLTFLILYKENEDTVSWWRSKMGKTRASEAKANSLRGLYALQENLPNNLLHGSDSIESVRREISALSDYIDNCIQLSEHNSKSILNENALSVLGILLPNEQLINVKQVMDYGTGESWNCIYHVSIIEEGGHRRDLIVRQKNLLSVGGDLQANAEEHYARLSLLSRSGILVPKLYGAHEGAVYADYVGKDMSTNIYDKLQRGIWDEESREAIIQLVRIGKKLDEVGFSATDFLADLIYSEKTSKFYYVDGGSDLGARQKNLSKSNLETLYRRFYKLQDKIKYYQENMEEVNS